jgi:hypothetical protein
MILFPMSLTENVSTFFAKLLWNVCELLFLRCPFAHIVFGIIIESKGKEEKP